MNKSNASFLRLLGTDWWLYAIVAIACVYLAAFTLHPSADTSTYIDAWIDSWSKREMNSFRTPIYPLYVGSMMSLSSEHYLLLSVIGQHIVFILSLVYLKRMLQWFTNSHFLVCVSVLAFSFLVIQWHNYVLTESFAISGSIFLFYCLLSFFRNGKRSSLIGSILWLAFLVFLRPSFLFLIPTCFLAYALFYRKYKREAFWGLIGVAFVSLLEIGYCKRFEEKYGFFLPSEVSIENRFQVAIMEEAISLDYSDDEEVKQYLQNASVFSKGPIYDLWIYMISTPLPEALTIKEKARIISQSRRDYPGKWICAVWHHYYGFLMSFPPRDVSLLSFVRLLVTIIIFGVNGLLILYSIFCCFMVFVRKKIPVIGIILCTAVWGNLAVITIGAQAEWYRLFLPSVSLLLLIIIIACTSLYNTAKLRREAKVIPSEKSEPDLR